MVNFTAAPLDSYSSIHRLPILHLFGLTLSFNFSIYAGASGSEAAQIQCKTRDAGHARPDAADFTVHHINRWRLSIADFHAFEDYVQSLKSNHKKNYRNTIKAYEGHQGNITLIEGDWSLHAETVYQLYLNVAKRRGARLFDLAFFKKIAAMPAYQLICLWHQQVLVGVLIIYDEAPVYHSMLLGFDYHHSSAMHAYSLLHYELIRHAIALGRYTQVDLGMTADKAKSMLNFKPVSICMDVCAKKFILKKLLRFADKMVLVQPGQDKKLKLRLLASSQNL